MHAKCFEFLTGFTHIYHFIYFSTFWNIYFISSTTTPSKSVFTTLSSVFSYRIHFISSVPQHSSIFFKKFGFYIFHICTAQSSILELHMVSSLNSNTVVGTFRKFGPFLFCGKLRKVSNFCRTFAQYSHMHVIRYFEPVIFTFPGLILAKLT